MFLSLFKILANFTLVFTIKVSNKKLHVKEIIYDRYENIQYRLASLSAIPGHRIQNLKIDKTTYVHCK